MRRLVSPTGDCFIGSFGVLVSLRASWHGELELPGFGRQAIMQKRAMCPDCRQLKQIISLRLVESLKFALLCGLEGQNLRMWP